LLFGLSDKAIENMKKAGPDCETVSLLLGIDNFFGFIFMAEEYLAAYDVLCTYETDFAEYLLTKMFLRILYELKQAKSVADIKALSRDEITAQLAEFAAIKAEYDTYMEQVKERSMESHSKLMASEDRAVRERVTAHLAMMAAHAEDISTDRVFDEMEDDTEKPEKDN
jgi:hypothetical protein